MEVVDNVTVAIMTKVNDLAARYGIEPYEFVAELRPEQVAVPELKGALDDTGRSILAYTISPSNPSKMKRFELMMETLGVLNSDGMLIGDNEKIIKTLNKALEVAPRPRISLS